MRRAALASGACLLVVCLLAPAAASAHSRSLAYVDWTLGASGASLRLRLTPLDHEALRVALADQPGVTPLDYLMERVRLRRGDAGCVPRDGRALSLGPGRVGFEWRVDCPAAGTWQVESDALFAEVAGHVALVSVRLPSGGVVERVLSESVRAAEVGGGAPDTALAAAGTFAREGVAHILSGWDHLVFLLALLVGLGRLRDVALAVTGFTVGHSLTLAGAALGLASPHGPTVEAMIALSIVVVAVENVWLAQDRSGRGLPVGLVAGLLVVASSAPAAGAVSGVAIGGLALFAACHFGMLARTGRPERLRVGVAALFGLLHGFGFAGAVVEMGLPPSHEVVALASFNVGVELGQLTVVALAGTVALVAGRVTRWERSGVRASPPVTVLGSSLAAALGTFWFVTRAFG